MKRWMVLTVGLYGLCVLGMFLFGFFLWEDIAFFEDLRSSRGILLLFSTFVILPLMLAEGVLLFLSPRNDSERPRRRRSLLTAAILGSLPMGLLFLGFLFSLGLLIWGEKRGGMFLYSWPVLIFPGLFWIFWGYLFYHHLSEKDSESSLSWITSRLLKGSILELLVALPSHVIARHRQECCAPFFTYCAIITGLSVALLAYGPGMYFLFSRKIRCKRKKSRFQK